jgi:hypothetical protein
MFGLDIEKMLKENPAVVEFQQQFKAMQQAIADLQQRVKELENKK